MAAAVKHARIGKDVSSATPTAHGNKYLQTTGTGKRTSMVPDNKNSNSKTEDSKSATSDQPASRRRSTFKGIASSLMTVRRMTKGSMDKDMAAAAAAAVAAKPKVRMENTYRTSPTREQHFNPCKADQLIHDVLEKQLQGQTYNATKAPTLAAVMSDRVKTVVKGLHCERYKLVTNVVLGPVQEQGMVVASRCLWDSSTDNSSTVSYNNGKIFAIATVFAVYYE